MNQPIDLKDKIAHENWQRGRDSNPFFISLINIKTLNINKLHSIEVFNFARFSLVYHNLNRVMT